MHRFASFAVCLSLLTAPVLAQSSAAPASPPAKHAFPKPKAEAAPGGGPGKVWVNTNSRVYHCYGDRYYGKTANGKYMTEAEAKTMGAHGSRGETCGSK